MSPFFGALLGALIAGFAVRYIIMILTAPVGFAMMALIGPEAGLEEPKRPYLIVPCAIVANTYNVFVLSAWAAFVAYYTKVFIAHPETEYSWLYYGLGFITCYGPIASMAAGEDEGSLATVIGLIATPLLYLLFVIWPTLISPIHWWWLQYLAFSG